jgi:transcription initiation factor TFIID subunit 2
MNESNKKRCERVLKKLWAHQASQPFYEPVDAVALNIPQYYEVIKRPMDLSVIRKNFDTNQYATIWEFERDIRQIFWNCYSFNDHESWVAKQCQALETFFNQIWSAEFANPNALKGEDKRLAQKVVNKLTFHDAAALFNEPVDLESLPDYGRVIKHPIDLRTIWEKLESGKYTSIKAIDQDVRLVFKNCYDYNGPGTYGNDQGKKLEKYYQNISREMRARITAAASSTSPSTAAAAASATSASPKRSHSSSPAPTKSTSSVTVTEVHPPAKKLKAVHHGKSGIAAPAGIPVMANIPAAATTSMPPIEPMDIDPVVLKPPSTVFSSPTVAKSPKSPVVMKSPSVPMKSPSIPMKSPSVPMKSPSVPMKSPAVPKKLPSTVAKSPVSDTPAKLHPTLLSKMESLIIKMMNRKESFGFLEPVSFDQTSELCLAYN